VSVWTTSPISIVVDDKICRSRWSKHETKVKSASNIAKNPLQGSKVRLPRIVHMKADLLNNIHNVWAGEGQVLKSSSKTAEVCSIRHRGPLSCTAAATLGLVSTGVEHGLHLAIPAQSKLSSMYCRYESRSPSPLC